MATTAGDEEGLDGTSLILGLAYRFGFRLLSVNQGDRQAGSVKKEVSQQTAHGGVYSSGETKDGNLKLLV